MKSLDVEEIRGKSVTTCEGNTIDISKFDMGRSLHIPLGEIKKYEYCEILKRVLPIHFIEKFERYDELYINEDGGSRMFVRWASVGIR
jgi:hypothetical protein